MTKQIQLKGGKFATVDDEDFEYLSTFKWHVIISTTTYAARTPFPGKAILMHRQIMDCPRNMLVDHIDGNGLNNTRSNLRICTRNQNAWNSKKFKGTNTYRGVCKFRNQFCAYITANGKQYHLGLFDDELSAARAYNEAAIKYHGEFARLNELP